MDPRGNSKKRAGTPASPVGWKDPRRTEESSHARLDGEEALNPTSRHVESMLLEELAACGDSRDTPAHPCEDEERCRDSDNSEERHIQEEGDRDSNGSSSDRAEKTNSRLEDRPEDSQDEDENDEDDDLDYDSEEDRLAQEAFEEDNSCTDENPANDHTLETADMSDEEHDALDTGGSTATNPINLGWSLWNDVVNIQVKIEERYPHEGAYLEAYDADKMAILAGLFKCHHEDFVKMEKKSHVDIGYHFTQTDHVKSIMNGGLLSKPDRAAQNINASYRGSARGEGIYTADDTSVGASGGYGDVGLLVARLKGVEANPSKCNSSVTYDDHDTCVCGNVAVLHHSAQCLVLMKFERALLQERDGPKAVLMAQADLQKLMDKYFPEAKIS